MNNLTCPKCKGLIDDPRRVKGSHHCIPASNIGDRTHVEVVDVKNMDAAYQADWFAGAPKK